MAYSITIRRVAEEARTELVAQVRAALAQVPEHEREQLKAAGQLADMLLAASKPGDVVDVAFSGSITPAARTFYFNVRTETLRVEASSTPGAEWTPSEGPLAMSVPTNTAPTGTAAAPLKE